MSDVKRILDAMCALVAALPGTANAHLMIGIHNCSPDGLRAFVDEGGHADVHSTEAHEWDVVQLYLDKVSVAAYGPHREIVHPTTDPAAVEAALAQAAEALSFGAQPAEEAF